MREIPPTAGMPLRLSDLVPAREPSLLESLVPMLGHGNLQTTCSGTAALVIALSTLAADSSRREVIVPAYTCPLVALAVRHCGLTLRICDLEADSLAMDMGSLARLCSAQTLAIVPTHLCGRVVDVASILRLAEQHGAAVIEDAAQAVGARFADGTPVGMLGDVGFFSLAVGKGLTTYEGGLLVSRHLELHARMQRTAQSVARRHCGWELRRSIELLGYAAFYRPRGLDMVYGRALRRALARGDVEAAVGDVFPRHIPLHSLGRWRASVAARAAARYPDFLLAQRDLALRRIALLENIPGLTVLRDSEGARGTWPVIAILLPDAGARKKALAKLWGAGVGVSLPFARILAEYPIVKSSESTDDFPNARDFSARVLTISNSPWLDDTHFAHIVTSIEHACH